MTVLYEKLYRSENVSEISIAEYLPSLIREIVSTYGPENHVALEIDAEDFELPVSVVTALGIIINELVTNALKYAFPEGGEGAITVKATCEVGRSVVTVTDDGVGLPPSVGLGISGGFGLTLVASLAEQHGFDLSIERSGGTRFIIGVGETGPGEE